MSLDVNKLSVAGYVPDPEFQASDNQMRQWVRVVGNARFVIVEIARPDKQPEHIWHGIEYRLRAEGVFHGKWTDLSREMWNLVAEDINDRLDLYERLMCVDYWNLKAA